MVIEQGIAVIGSQLLSEFLDYLDLNKFDVDPTGRNLEFEETKDNLDKLISNLPYKCQSVFKLSRYEDLKNKEIADQLNISQRTVETHISNALKILKRNISLPIVFLVSFFC